MSSSRLLSRLQRRLATSTTVPLVSARHVSMAARAQAKQKLDEQDVPELSKFMKLEQRKQERRSLDGYDIPNFDSFLEEKAIPFTRTPTNILQVNIGLYCNQSCNHCHVESSPQRTEMMDRPTSDRLLELFEKSETVNMVDITGGAPELVS